MGLLKRLTRYSDSSQLLYLQLRRHIETMSHEHYVGRSYYCKWATSMALGLIERGVINYSDLDHVLLGERRSKDSKPLFSVGQKVRVKSEQSMARWRKPHLRTPGYIFGVSGVVESWEGETFVELRQPYCMYGQTSSHQPKPFLACFSA